jgi:hypothetical protein
MENFANSLGLKRPDLLIIRQLIGKHIGTTILIVYTPALRSSMDMLLIVDAARCSIVPTNLDGAFRSRSMMAASNSDYLCSSPRVQLKQAKSDTADVLT